MTPIPFDLPRRILPPTTAYAAGLVCELRPDLADGVRSAVLGDAAVTALDAMAYACVETGDAQGVNVLGCLREIVRHRGDTSKDLRAMVDAVQRLDDALYDCFDWRASPTFNHADLCLQLMYWRGGFAPCWQHAKTPNDLRCLRQVITLHAHTVSPNAAVRAAWAKAHLDALA